MIGGKRSTAWLLFGLWAVVGTVAPGPTAAQPAPGPTCKARSANSTANVPLQQASTERTSNILVSRAAKMRTR